MEKKVVIHWIDKIHDDGALHISKTSVSIDQNANFDGWGQPSNQSRSSGSVFALTETYYYMMSDKKLYKGKDLLENSNVNSVNPPPSAQYDYTPNVLEQKFADDKSWAGWNPAKWARILSRDIDAPDNAQTVEDVSMGMLAFTSVVGLPAMARGMLRAEGVAVDGVNAAQKLPGAEKRLVAFEKHSPNWAKGSKSEALNKFVDGVEGTLSADGVKTRYFNTKTQIEVIVDNENKYFRIFDQKKGQYVGMDGKVPSTSTLKGQAAKDHVQSQTHIINND